MNNIEQTPKSILVIDDNYAIRVVIKDILELEGHQVITANNGLEALEVLKTTKPNLILLDMRMPVMDGWEFRKIQSANPDYADIPLFVFFAGSKNDLGLNELKPTGYLIKPIDIDNLLDTLGPYLH